MPLGLTVADTVAVRLPVELARGETDPVAVSLCVELLVRDSDSVDEPLTVAPALRVAIAVPVALGVGVGVDVVDGLREMPLRTDSDRPTASQLLSTRCCTPQTRPLDGMRSVTLVRVQHAAVPVPRSRSSAS